MVEVSTSEKSENIEVAKRQNHAAIWTTYVNIILYALCFQLQRPVEPFLVSSLSSKGDPAVVAKDYGKLQSFFNTAQTLGSPIVGILLDRIGTRKTSAIIFLATALSYAILACASDLPLLFVSKVPTVFQAAFLVAQATAAEATAGATARARALGRMTTAYTVGATMGPALGGVLADQGDLYLSAKLAAAGSLLSVILSLIFLPDSTRTFQDKKRKTKEKRTFLMALHHSRAVAMRSSVWPLLFVKFFGGIVASMFSTALPLTLTQKMKFDASYLGMSMSVPMFVVAIFGAFCMAPLVKFLGPDGMAKIGLFGRAFMVPVIAMIISNSIENTPKLAALVVAILALHALSAHSLATGLTTQSTGAVGEDEQGTLLGLEHGLFGMARIVGPPLGTTLLACSSDNGFLYLAAVCCVLDLTLVICLLVIKSHRQLHKNKQS